MGCFLACFGSSKHGKRRNQRHKVLPGNQRNASYNSVQSAVSLPQDYPEKPICPVPEIQDKPENQPSSTSRKKVTFDSNVKTYEHVFPHEGADFLAKNEEGSEEEKGAEGNLAKSSRSHSSSEESSITSSSGTYPTNHRYQNCRDSDDELGYEESDLDDDDNDDDYGELDYVDFDENYDDKILESMTRSYGAKTSMVVGGLPEEELKSTGLNRTAQDRSGYVHPVLNPVENLTQWKTVKAKEIPQLKQQKENINLEQESWISFKELSFDFESKFDYQPKKSNQDVAVDASLSNWLSSSESTPVNNTSTVGSSTTFMPEQSVLQGSTSPRSYQDRPILGALTVEELKQFSASSSLRKSPSRSPDDMPIIGTVGTYWNHTGSAKDSDSANSFKGIPNTTSKYREDKRVNWHSTPFEKRLDRALNRGAA
ncbi:hypothetical protein CFOL_v3_29161 [Cephalotus follicularis]|uniref:Uncharacterized protein n=1 Tax=Cephalotus follicularis TaxID=3775 RepID=A0A1Q3CZR8_CEPFO|nr:hypothetical protein CFOL_v3_29161 [Cephalotus follicularis]